jgi:hypothetical protein
MRVEVPANLDEYTTDRYCLLYWVGFQDYRKLGRPGGLSPRESWPEAYDAGFNAAVAQSMNWNGTRTRTGNRRQK